MADLAVFPESFQNLVRVLDNGCWGWTGERSKEGYGRFRVAGRRLGAHRWAWIYINGDVPNGKDMDHYRFPELGCIGPPCANPGHVRPVTPTENALRGDGPCARNARKTACWRGHELAGDNLYIIPSSGSRMCRECQRIKERWQGGARPEKRTHCPAGHAYDDANTRTDPKSGNRICRACHRERARTARQMARK